VTEIEQDSAAEDADDIHGRADAAEGEAERDIEDEEEHEETGHAHRAVAEPLFHRQPRRHDSRLPSTRAPREAPDFLNRAHIVAVQERAATDWRARSKCVRDQTGAPPEQPV